MAHMSYTPIQALHGPHVPFVIIPLLETGSIGNSSPWLVLSVVLFGFLAGCGCRTWGLRIEGFRIWVCRIQDSGSEGPRGSGFWASRVQGPRSKGIDDRLWISEGVWMAPCAA